MTRLRLVALLAAFVLPGLPVTARAEDPPGTYVMSVCKAGTTPVPLDGWVRADLSIYAPMSTDACATGGDFGFLAKRQSPAPPPGKLGYEGWDAVVWTWQAPPDVRVSGVRGWREGSLIRPSAYNFEALGGAAVATIDRESSLSRGAAFEKTGLDATQLVIRTDCKSGLQCAANGQYISFMRMEVVLRDSLPPAVLGPASGTLLQPVPLSGVATIKTAFKDQGGGLAGAEIIVDGIQRSIVPVGAPGCSKPYETSVPCPLSGLLDVPVDTTTLNNGEHRFELSLVDVAGNRTVFGPWHATVHNPVNELPAPARPGKVVPGRMLLQAKYGTRVALTGVVIDPSGAPIPGATVAVTARERLPGATFANVETLSTDANGGFRVLLPTGPSRTVRLVYGDSVADVEVRVPAPVTLKASPGRTRNGKTIRFTGRIQGTAVSGPRVELQARVGKKWVLFESVPLRKGHFQARYRFTRTYQTTRYRFRAVVRAAADLPFVPSSSKVVSVVVRP